jgi:hypothetical protein
MIVIIGEVWYIYYVNPDGLPQVKQGVKTMEQNQAKVMTAEQALSIAKAAIGKMAGGAAYAEKLAFKAISASRPGITAKERKETAFAAIKAEALKSMPEKEAHAFAEQVVSSLKFNEKSATKAETRATYEIAYNGKVLGRWASGRKGSRQALLDLLIKAGAKPQDWGSPFGETREGAFEIHPFKGVREDLYAKEWRAKGITFTAIA